MNARAASNLCAVLARLFVCGLFPSDVVWGFLTDATARLSELDATLTLGVLRVAGPRTRAEDPIGMKRFVESLRERVANARSDVDKTNGGSGLSRRARLMLQMVVDLKNNKRAVGADAGGAGGREGEDRVGLPNNALACAQGGCRRRRRVRRVADADVRQAQKRQGLAARPVVASEAAGTEAVRGARSFARRRTRASAAAESAAARGRARVRRSCARPRPCA